MGLVQATGCAWRLQILLLFLLRPDPIAQLLLPGNPKKDPEENEHEGQKKGHCVHGS
jgi:hypothetical protein